MTKSLNKNDYYWKILQLQVQEKKIEKVFDVFNRRKIPVLLIKGWAAARNYPEPFERTSVDIDLAVRPESFADAERLLLEENLADVDLHKGLRHLDNFDWSDLYAGRRFEKIGDTTVAVLRPEDHLRVLCVHWLNDGGADRERLRDIYYAVTNRPADFDWKRCLDAAGERRKRWIACTIALAGKYLGLKLDDTPLFGEIERLPVWLVETIESEWKRNVRLTPLEYCLDNRTKLFEQIKIRFPPNPIQATVEMDGDFDAKTRIPYQIASFLKRVNPSLKKIGRTVVQNARRKISGEK